MNFRFLLALGSMAALVLAGCASPAGSNNQDASPFRLQSTDGGDERIVTDVRINGRPARLGLDTGAGLPFILFAPVVARLGLTVATAPAPDPNPTPGQTNVGTTAPTTVTITGQTLADVELRFAEIPPEVPLGDDCDGILGWPAIARNIWIFAFSGEKPVITMVKSVAHDGPNWRPFTVPQQDTLSLKPVGQYPSGRPRMIIDTGNGGGLLLPPARWREWKAAHPDAALTIHSAWMAGQKLAVHETAWADEITVGELVFRDVPVEEADAAYLQQAAEGEEIVVLGVAALKRLDLVINARAQVAYVSAVDNRPPTAFPHNRTGVVFLPADGAGDDLVAHVLAGSPAFRAGVRDGDVLLKVDQQDVTGWRKQPDRFRRVFNSRAPAGTKWKLEVRRGGATHAMTVVAEDLLGPGLKRQQP